MVFGHKLKFYQKKKTTANNAIKDFLTKPFGASY